MSQIESCSQTIVDHVVSKTLARLKAVNTPVADVYVKYKKTYTDIMIILGERTEQSFGNIMISNSDDDADALRQWCRANKHNITTTFTSKHKRFDWNKLRRDGYVKYKINNTHGIKNHGTAV